MREELMLCLLTTQAESESRASAVQFLGTGPKEVTKKGGASMTEVQQRNRRRLREHMEHIDELAIVVHISKTIRKPQNRTALLGTTKLLFALLRCFLDFSAPLKRK